MSLCLTYGHRDIETYRHTDMPTYGHKDMFKTIEWRDNRVVMIDQTKLPAEEVYVTFTTAREVADAIRNMVIRGAPAIGVAAAMGVALGALEIRTTTSSDLISKMKPVFDLLAKTRPTAVNLRWGLDRMEKCLVALKNTVPEEIKKGLVQEAQKICAEDIEINRMIGRHGESLISSGDRILSNCNAGALATAGYGTALGVLYAAQEKGKKFSVFADETRPFLQGARLTAWELSKNNIPVTLITDSMAGWMMKKGEIERVIVGADRIAANGDVANKIGTYSLAVLAKRHEIPFYVAAPLSTIDLKTPTGEEIPIEERSTGEVTTIGGKSIAPPGVPARHPAFDVTPHELVTAIITERGIVRESYSDNLRKLFVS